MSQVKNTLQPTALLTKAQYLALPAAQRRRHKDGTNWVLVRRGQVSVWEQIRWDR